MSSLLFYKAVWFEYLLTFLVLQAMQDPDRATRFAEVMSDAIAEARV